MAQKTETYQPKTVIWREPNYEVHLGQVLGVLDYDTNFDNTFQKWKLMIQFIDDVTEAITQDIIPLREKKKLDLIPDRTAIMKMDKIWNGQTYLRIVKNHEQTKVLLRELFYKEPDPVYEVKNEEGEVVDKLATEIIPMPELKNMLPVGEVQADSWGIMVRTTMSLKYAWIGANYATIINDGRFIHYLSDGQVPKFEQKDMDSLVLRTSIFTRHVYNAIMDILPKFFNKNYFVFATNVQKIMKWMKEEDMTWLHDLDLGQEDQESPDEIFSYTE